MSAVEEYNVVSVSGGKDSQATLIMAIEQQARNMIAVFADTGNEHEYTYEHIDYLAKTLGIEIRTIRADFSDSFERRRAYLRGETQGGRALREWPEDVRLRALEVLQPTGNPFLDLCMLKGRFPSRKAQFCTQFLKREPIMNQVLLPLLTEGHRVVSWQGTRRDESPARSGLAKFEKEFGDDETGAGLWLYRPIIEWSAQQTIAYSSERGIKSNPLYMQGLGRVGCMPCINVGKSDIREIADRFPEHIERIAKWEEIVAQASKREMATFFPARGEKNVTLENNGIHEKVAWSRTKHGGKQLQMFLETPMCSSSYGLCE